MLRITDGSISQSVTQQKLYPEIQLCSISNAILFDSTSYEFITRKLPASKIREVLERVQNLTLLGTTEPRRNKISKRSAP